MDGFLGDFVIRVKKSETLPEGYRAELWVRPADSQDAKLVSISETQTWLAAMISARSDMPLTPHKVAEALVPRSMEDITS